jgi:cell division FtsZ-interacting protein ZapD
VIGLPHRLANSGFMNVEEIFKTIDGAEMRYKQTISKLEGCVDQATIENIIQDLTKAHGEIVAALRMYAEKTK